MRVELIKHTEANTRARIREFLTPDEPHALFLLGNLRRSFPGTYLYAAVRGSEWAGIAGYYDGPRSFIPYSREPETIRELTRCVASVHPDIRWLNGIEYA